MSTIVSCTARLCRYLADGVCRRDRIELENVEFRYRGFHPIYEDTMHGDEQFCRSFASAGTVPFALDDPLGEDRLDAGA